MVDHARDSRQGPQIPSSSAFLTVFGMQTLRLGSLNEIEQQLHIPGRWDPWVGAQKPSADTLGYALEHADLEGMRWMLAQAGTMAKRKKVFHRLYPDNHWVAAIDGIETHKSRKRCCDLCCKRKVKIKVRGVETEITEYYHREVVAQLVGVTPAFILDVEPILPEETEVTAALRLLDRSKETLPRFIDVLTFDAFYLQAPLVTKALELGYGLVIVLKQENRDLYQDAEGLFPTMTPEIITGVGSKTQLWDLKGLTSWTQLGRPVRVVRSLEEKLKRERIGKEWVERQVVEDWRWVVIFPDDKAQPPLDLVPHWGHARWDEETRGFGELTQHWHLNHCYHHHPTAIIASHLILFLAFFLSTIFFQRNLKPQARQGKTRIHLARLLADDLVRGGWESFWAQPP